MTGLVGSRAEAAAAAVVGVLLDAFEVEPERRASIEAETVASLGHPSFTYYLVYPREHLSKPEFAAFRTWLLSVGEASA